MLAIEKHKKDRDFHNIITSYVSRPRFNNKTTRTLRFANEIPSTGTAKKKLTSGDPSSAYCFPSSLRR